MESAEELGAAEESKGGLRNEKGRDRRRTEVEEREKTRLVRED